LGVRYLHTVHTYIPVVSADGKALQRVEMQMSSFSGFDQVTQNTIICLNSQHEKMLVKSCPRWHFRMWSGWSWRFLAKN